MYLYKWVDKIIKGRKKYKGFIPEVFYHPKLFEIEGVLLKNDKERQDNFFTLLGTVAGCGFFAFCFCLEVDFFVNSDCFIFWSLCLVLCLFSSNTKKWVNGNSFQLENYLSFVLTFGFEFGCLLFPLLYKEKLIQTDYPHNNYLNFDFDLFMASAWRVHSLGI